MELRVVDDPDRQPVRSRPDPAGRARTRPDPTPVRVAIGAGGLVTMSALVAAIVVPPAPASQSAPAAAVPATPATEIRKRPVQYVQLAPGQSAPPGATVIDAKAPKPITIVTKVPAPPQQTVVVRTTQSGKPVP